MSYFATYTDGKETNVKIFSEGKIYEEEMYEKGHITSKTRYDKRGKPTMVLDWQNHTGTYFDNEGHPICAYQYDKSTTPIDAPNRMVILDEKGNPVISDFRTEKNKDSSLTPDAYLSLLAQKLNTPDKLRIFFEACMQYVHDSADPKNPLKKGTESKKGDYWQLAQETVQRVENGKMLGDCDDYAFLAREILKQQGKTPFVVLMPGHAECFWTEKIGNEYLAYSLGTFGFDEQKGNTLEEALNGLFKKYESKGLGVSDGFNYKIKNNSLEIIDIAENHEKKSEIMPIDIFEKPALRDLWQKKEFGEAEINAFVALDDGNRSATFYKKVGQNALAWPSKAASLLEKAHEKDPNDRAVCADLFRCLTATKQFDKAEKLFDTAAHILQEEAMAQVTSISSPTVSKNAPASLIHKVFRAAIVRYGEDAFLRKQYAMVLRDSGEDEESAKMQG